MLCNGLSSINDSKSTFFKAHFTDPHITLIPETLRSLLSEQMVQDDEKHVFDNLEQKFVVDAELYYNKMGGQIAVKRTECHS